MGNGRKDQEVMELDILSEISKTGNLKIQPTGIETLDEILNGGMPEGHCVLLSGQVGAGKTILAMQWLFAGREKYNEPGVYITLTESVNKAIKVGSRMNFFDNSLIGPGGVFFTDLRTVINDPKFDLDNIDQNSVDELIAHIRRFVENNQAKRLVIDSITAVAFFFKSRDLMRYSISKLSAELFKLDCTCILLSEASEQEYGIFGVEEFISDGLIHMEYSRGEQQMVRKMTIMKMRGISYRSGAVVFDISQDGLIIYPKLPINRTTAKTDFDVRSSTGIDVLDEMTGGGYPEGHMVLIAGNTGTGKSTFGLHYLKKGLDLGESCVYVALEESVPQILKTAAAHDWDFTTPYEQGQIEFISLSLIDVYPDKLLYQIKDAVERTNAKRVVIDSVSSMESATMTKEKLREFMLQISTYFKTNGITCLMMYLAESMFGAEKGVLLAAGQSNEVRLSSIVDGVIILRYFEFKQCVTKLINILKLRGSAHDKNIREYIVEKEGVRISTTQFKP